MKKLDDVGFTAKFSWLKEKGKKFDMNRDGLVDIEFQDAYTIVKQTSDSWQLEELQKPEGAIVDVPQPERRTAE